MMTAEHRRPFAAFMLLLAFACAIMANGLRDRVVQVFVDSGAPRPLISAVVPDILLGRSLRDAPQAEPAEASAGESAGEAADAVSEVETSSSATLTEPVVTLVRSASTPVRIGDSLGRDPRWQRRCGLLARFGPAGRARVPLVVPVVPADPVQVPRPPLQPATPGFGVDLPGTDDGVRGHGNKPSKGVTRRQGRHQALLGLQQDSAVTASTAATSTGARRAGMTTRPSETVATAAPPAREPVALSCRMSTAIAARTAAAAGAATAVTGTGTVTATGVVGTAATATVGTAVGCAETPTGDATTPARRGQRGPGSCQPWRWPRQGHHGAGRHSAATRSRSATSSVAARPARPPPRPRCPRQRPGAADR